MYIQKVIDYNPIGIDTLFKKVNKNRVSFGTYFNSFDYFNAHKYLNSDGFALSFCFSGETRFRLIKETTKCKKIIFEKTISSFQTTKFVTPFISILDYKDKGIIYPEFSNIDVKFKVSNIQYEVNAQEHNTEIIIVICAFKREDYVIKNIKRLCNCRSFIKKVIIVDNGRTLNEKELSNDFIKIIPNENSGGSGGFIRGIQEAKSIGCTHIFLMDDDISYLDETIERTYNYIKCLDQKHEKDWLGFSMLINDHPTIQYEMGSYWNGFKMFINNHNINLSKKCSLLKNVRHQKYNYSAWWSIVMPISVIDDHKLPLSLFVKFDDIEYAMRRNKEEIIFTNGFGIWHENFKNKLRPSVEYYLMRNGLITNSVNNIGKFKSTFRYFGKSIKSLLKFKLENNEMINLGLNDFLKGTANLSKLDCQYYSCINSNNLNIKKYLFIKYAIKTIYNSFKLFVNYDRVANDYIKELNIKNNLASGSNAELLV